MAAGVESRIGWTERETDAFDDDARLCEDTPLMGSLLRALLAALTFATLFAATRPAHAYTWMIRHGYGGCTTCHTDPSGGETLTRYGRAQSDLLSAHALRQRECVDRVGRQRTAER